jgi:hypothetical protein
MAGSRNEEKTAARRRRFAGQNRRHDSTLQTSQSMEDGLMSLKHDIRPHAKPVRKLPDLAICRVRPSGIGNLVYCLVPEPESCKHAELFKSDTFCFHPESWKFGAAAE